MGEFKSVIYFAELIVYTHFFLLIEKYLRTKLIPSNRNF